MSGKRRERFLPSFAFLHPGGLQKLLAVSGFAASTIRPRVSHEA